ncbi:TPA: hypothetical protein L4T46_000328 [Pseudomonas aeruginosa]|nr:hypothetical protein [Pseudomonas aeruginosa]
MALLASGVGHARTAFPVGSRPIGGDESFSRLAETSESPVEYMGRLAPRNPRIEEGRFDEESGLLRYKVRNDDMEPGRDFFLAKILDFDWSYYLYHDLYTASFRFLSVRAVAVLDSGDRQAAWLPARTDMSYLMESPALERALYRKALDHGAPDLPCMNAWDRAG